MTAQLELEVYQHLVRYLSCREDLQSFRTWFDQNTWDRGSWDSPLLGHIELALAELSSKHRTEDELRSVLRSSLPPVTLQLAPMLSSVPNVISGASNTLIDSTKWVTTVKLPDLVVGKLREVEYV
jgi:hypothetical protein